ncbi:DNA polymerase III subunit beta [Schaalia sp. 19OD2882]|uniref:DNA polymerase III subunit beta n=1 Tax=Schaalia sp. 19OD2882 TaxID=2794089 RepID=UPI001C1EC819|nr:DNA polymerase III subunit beta [Schaalia sp. 19OD2882]QWW19577.1 DNA polymerase III subunit beta [Schaalia sp. 19OD2882]
MKFTVARDVLAEAVSWTARALPVRPASPILAGVRITAAGEELTLASFDYEVSANSRIPASVEEPGEVLVSGRLLADISKSLPNRPVTIELDGQKVNLTCGSSHFALAVMPLDEYPQLPAQPATTGAVDSHTLSQAVSQVSVAASKDDTLPLLTAVRIEVEGERMTLLATDRYRLAMRELEWQPVDSSVEEAALVKARILQDVAKSMTSGAKVELGLSHDAAPGASSLIGFTAGGRRTTSTLMDGDYPPVRRLFPESTSIQAVADRHVLLEAVKRVSLVAERKTSVRLSFSEGQVVLEAGQGDNAQASEAIEAQLFGEEIATAFNPQFLIDGLSVIDTDFVRFGFTHPNKPAVMTGQEKADGGEVTHFRYLLMPIRFGM